jgi:hypothetical protein
MHRCIPRDIENEKKSDQNGENSNESYVINCYRVTLIISRGNKYTFIYLFLFNRK